jgi:hypothetical protein
MLWRREKYVFRNVRRNGGDSWEFSAVTVTAKCEV